MNYDIMAELLAEGFKREQLLEEDWEALKKELTNLYVAGKITERQISTRLSKAGMGSLSKNAAYKIAHDPDNAQKREAALQRVKDAEEEKAKRAALSAQAAKHQTRGSAAADYNNSWLVREMSRRLGEKIYPKAKSYARKINSNLSEEEINDLVEESVNKVLYEAVIEEGVNLKKEIEKTVKAYDKFVSSIEQARGKLIHDEDASIVLKEKVKKIDEYGKTIKDLKKILNDENITPERAKKIKKNLKQFRKELKTLKQDSTFMKVIKSIGVGYLFAALLGGISCLISSPLIFSGDEGLTAAGLGLAGTGRIAADVGGIVKGVKHYQERNENEVKFLKKKTSTAKELTEGVKYFNY